MQKITEIRVQYKVNKTKKIDGADVTVEENVTRYEPVKYVDGFSRLGHFLLDRIFLYIFFIIIGVAIGFILFFLGASYLADDPDFGIYDTLISWLVLQPAYYFIFEASIQSTPGKAILGRIVVDEYGNKPTAKQILIRSYSRCVPFEWFSCLGTTGWHDDWSGTFVIRKKDLKELKLLQKVNEVGNVPPNTEKKE